MTLAWLTPFSPIPAGYYCARIRVPNGSDWRGPLNGALQLLAETWNWEEFGNLDPAATVDTLAPLIFEAQNSGDWCMIGAVWPYASETPPPHTLICDGQILNRVDYPFLYDAIDPAFKIDDDTFYVPDLIYRFVFGANPGSVGDFPVATTGGEQDVTLTVDQMPSHTHSDAGHFHTTTDAGPNATTIGPGIPEPTAIPVPFAPTSGGNANIQPTGGGQSHTNMPPYLALRWCIVFE